MLIDPELARTVAALLFTLLGAVFRFARIPRRFGYGLGLPWTWADEEIWRRSNRRFGLLLLWWAAWLGVQIAVGLRPSWAGSLWAPLIIVVTAAVTFPARLYLERYGTLRVRRIDPGADRPYPARGGWIVVVLREAVPLAGVLAAILAVRGMAGELPERIPVRFAVRDGATDWRLRDEALDMLRHRTAVVYLLLVLSEGGLLLYRWIRGARRDMAETLLTRGHWMFFLFRLGWVGLLAGGNLAFVEVARGAGWPPAWLGPGAVTMAGLFAWVIRDQSRATWAPPE